MHYELFLTDVFFTLSVIFTVGFGVYIFKRSPRRDLGMTFFLMSISLALFQISHVIGINITDPDLSRIVFMFNLVNIPIVCFTAHFILALTDRIRQERFALILFYFSGAVLLVFYLVNPEHFLFPSRPKLYFPNYYEPGQYFWIMRLYIYVVSAHFTYHALREYFATVDQVIRNRLRYIIAGLVISYMTSAAAVFLIFDVRVDPIFATLMSLSCLPLGYASIRYNLVDITIVARRAFLSALMVTIVTSLLSIASFSTLYVANILPSFPLWLMPVGSSLIAAAVGYLVWRKMHETDVLKYEFITVITHKFRTPLTHIKWATELLLSTEENEDKKHEIKNIRESNAKLIDLTSTLIALADTDRPVSSQYKHESLSIGDLVDESVAAIKERIEERKTILTVVHDDNGAVVAGDRERLKFVAQTLIENAVSYTPIGGSVNVRLSADTRHVYLVVADTGIGIAKSELQHLFAKFYRSSRAKVADTEGVGVGLFLVRSILERHSGKIGVESAGEGKGTTFTVVLPRI
jgi:signal transduction histidine kinase